MPFYFNGTVVDKVVFNGSEISKLVFNGTEVYTSSYYAWVHIGTESSDPGFTTYDIGTDDISDGRYYLEQNLNPKEYIGLTRATTDGYVWNVYEVQEVSYVWEYVRVETSDPNADITFTDQGTRDENEVYLKAHYPPSSYVGQTADYYVGNGEYELYEVRSV